jgi:hypothetical protein
LDTNYLKSIRKQGKKDELLTTANFNKAVDVIIETKNKNIKVNISEYQ